MIGCSSVQIIAVYCTLLMISYCKSILSIWMHVTEGQEVLHPLMGLLRIWGKDIYLMEMSGSDSPPNNMKCTMKSQSSCSILLQRQESTKNDLTVPPSHFLHKEVWNWKGSYCGNTWLRKVTVAEMHPDGRVFDIRSTGERRQRACSKNTALSLHQPWNACWMALIWGSVITLMCTKWFSTCSLSEIPSVSQIRETKAILSCVEWNWLEHSLTGKTLNTALGNED